jgi:CRISPR-associated endonuclease/helicase Cas3
MTLIKTQNFTLFFPFKINILQYKIKEFEKIENVFLSDGLLDGAKVWQQFKKLNEIEKFTEMKIKKTKINSLLQFFTFNITKYSENQTFSGQFTDEESGIYYIEKYDIFITNDLKFNRKAFQEECKSQFF